MAKHLTPAQRGAVAARYEELANANAVAREFGITEGAVRKIIAKAGCSKKSALHAQACARAIREGRRALTKTASRLHHWIEEHGDPASPTMEPGDVSKMATALRGVISGVVEIDEHRNRAALSRLTRDLRRAEIELAKLKIAAGGVDRHEHTLVTPEMAKAAARAVFGSASALEQDGSGGDGSDHDGASPVESDAVPVSDPLDH